MKTCLKRFTVMSKAGLLLIVFIFLFSISNTASANEKKAKDDSVYQIDQTVITATRTEKELFEVPANVTVITSKDIREKNAVTMTDILKDAPGIFVDRPKGIADATGEITMRGFGENNILVLYDGMTMNEAYSGGVQWAAIPIETIERIEIAKGAASSLYGGRAVGGVINIITKKSESMKPEGNIYGYYGTNNSWRRGFSLRHRLNNKFSYSLGYENQATDGFKNKVASSTSSGSSSSKGTVGTGVVASTKADGKPRYIIGSQGNNAGKSDNINLKMNYDFDKDKNLSYSYTHTKFKYWTDDPVTYIHDADGKPLYAGAVKLPNGKWFNFTENNFTDNYGRRETDVHSIRYADDKNSLYLNFGMTDTKESGYSTGRLFDGSTPGNNTSYPTRTVKADLLKTWHTSDNNSLTGGFDWQSQKMTRTSSKLARWHDKDSVTSINDIQGGRSDVFALFLQNDYYINEKWEVYAGLRWDHYKKYDGFYDDLKNPITKHDEASYDEISPKISIKYQPNESTSFYASYGHSFNPPSIYKLYRTDNNYDANPFLKPETSNTIEVGMKKKFGVNTAMNLSIYNAKTDNMIVAETIPGKDKKRYNNIEKAERTGVDFDLNHKFSDRWNGFLNYSWIDAKDDDNQKINWIPTNTFHAGLTYRYDKLTATLTTEYISDRNKPDSVSGVYLSYDEVAWVSNIGLTYQVSKDCKATFSVLNIFDKDYYLWYAAPGRTFTAGLVYEF